ncbi:M23 family metallopeptidase [Novosphingobium sp. KCTC 2891]|uniref:M23 family metallopeptidase n=1 Tax=Novosphingobium sp. KCTC 2891 TaxID=2989730 RepID=UPI002223D15C|nr:M23 family metallopeptidase [Novosphingobium sp. KCTC 2891]MCW1382323.1 M23 family metallopeptidase [Novosphingobium sp. KCTC 2891]
MPSITRDGLLARLRNWFPEREFFMRSQGQVRFIRISSRVQIAAAGIVAALLLVWMLALAWVLVSQLLASSERDALLKREAAVASAESRVAKYRGGIGDVAQDLERRQDYIEKMVESHVGALPADLPKGTVSDSSAEADKTVKKISMELPEAAGLARIEARQLALIERLTRYADARSAQAETAIRRVGLNPALIASADRRAMGGPLIRVATGFGGTDDPRMARFGASLERMSAMEQGLARIPNTLPARLEYISSGFGYRADPFDGSAAFHAGLDFRGPIGAPIHAAAAGTVSFTGVRQGYGNCVEISHGNGLMTRYAHMSRIGARLGEKVDAGAVIGQIGSTGRSTGPHLHFEVRINDRPVNPRPFLESNRDVFQEARAGRPDGSRG